MRDNSKQCNVQQSNLKQNYFDLEENFWIFSAHWTTSIIHYIYAVRKHSAVQISTRGKHLTA